MAQKEEEALLFFMAPGHDKGGQTVEGKKHFAGPVLHVGPIFSVLLAQRLPEHRNRSLFLSLSLSDF